MFAKNEVESLLQSHEQTGGILESSPSASADTLIGRTLGSYTVKSLLGVGGMGAVYRAWDSRLKRDVAIKVLPDEFSRDTERVLRFQREAEMLAALNQPHIAAIYDLGETDDVRYLVLELVEGETLADRIRRSPIPLAEALKIASQIAEALEAAHEKGIIHRDLKPANVRVTPEGIVKVLDFGLAKPTEAVAAHPLDLPTKVTLSAPGTLLGTAAYMSPEQARGEPAGKEADIWAFGCVLFEMLSGHATFRRKTITETLARVLEGSPDWKLLPAETPPLVARLLRRCLEKDPQRRLHHLGDARNDLEDALLSDPSADGSAMAPSEGAIRPRWKKQLAAAAIVLVAIGFGWTAQNWRAPTQEPLHSDHTQILPPTGGQFTGAADPNHGGMAISPDGRFVAHVIRIGAQRGLWLYPLDLRDGEPKFYAGTEEANQPFFSPDSKFIAFGEGGSLKKLDRASGAVVTLAADATGGFGGGVWLEGGRILFAGYNSSLLQVSDNAGGLPTPVTELDVSGGELAHRYPQWLGDDRILYHSVNKKPEDSGVYAISLSKPRDRVAVLTTRNNALYSSGHLLSWSNRTLQAREFDPVTFQVGLDAPPVAEGVTLQFAGKMNAVVSGNGDLLYDASGRKSLYRWYDRAGAILGLAGDPSQGAGNLRISRSGRLAALQGSRGLWLLDERGLPTLTERGSSPLFAPDDRTIIFTRGNLNLFRMSVGGASVPMTESSKTQYALDWSPDGHLLYIEMDKETKADLWWMAVDSSGKPVGKPQSYLTTAATESWAAFSPEAGPHWVAYMSNESGTYEIYVRSFPNPGRPTRVSISGGAYPKWSPEGLYYLRPDGRLIMATLKISSDRIEVVSREELFTWPSENSGGSAPSFDVYPGGTRFLVNVTEQSTEALNLVTNWPALITKP